MESDAKMHSFFICCVPVNLKAKTIYNIISFGDLIIGLLNTFITFVFMRAVPVSVF